MLRELRDGDVLGDHTFTHPDLTTVPDVREQLQRTIGVIRSLTGYTPCVFRPPYGDYDASVLETARSLGLATVLWNVDPSDWAQPPHPDDRLSACSNRCSRGRSSSPTTAAGPAEHARRLPADHRGPAPAGSADRDDPRTARLPPGVRPLPKLCDGLGVPRSKLPAQRDDRPGALGRRGARNRVSAARARALGCVEYGLPAFRPGTTAASSARSSVVNGTLRGSKEQRSFKPQAEGSIPSGRIFEPVAPAWRRFAFSGHPASEGSRELSSLCWSYTKQPLPWRQIS